MSSNKELKKQAIELANLLEIPENEIDLDQDNDGLVELVTDLSDKLANADKPKAPEAPKVKPAKKAPYVIAPGKAVTSKRGVLGEGDACEADNFAGGEDTLKNLVKNGFVIKNK